MIDDEKNKWWYSATDVVFAVTESNNPRVYWNAIKRRNPELNTFCRQLKLYSNDGKKYLNDVIDEYGIKKLGFIIRNKNNESFQKWILGSLDPIDEQSKRKAHSLFESDILDLSLIGKTLLLQQIHAYLLLRIVGKKTDGVTINQMYAKENIEENGMFYLDK